MALPFSRNTTYTPGAQVKSFDLNDLQDRVVNLYSDQYFELVEDFDQINQTITSFPHQLSRMTLVGDAHSEARLDDDSSPPAGTYGRVKLATVDGTATIMGAQMSRLGLSTGDYVLEARASVESRSHVETVAAFGFTVGLNFPAGGAFVVGNNSSNWMFLDANGSLHASSIVVTDGQMVRLRMARIAGTMTAYVDTGSGLVSVYSGADTVDMNACIPWVKISGKTWSAHQVYATVDYLKFGPLPR